VLIRAPKASDENSRTVTPEELFLSRRRLLSGLTGSAAVLLGAPRTGFAEQMGGSYAELATSTYSTDEPTTPFDYATRSNNFYEFGSDKQRPEQMPGQQTDVLDWPYREGLRMDEAMHPLSLLAVGMYGRELPNQNGAPLRLVVPWKYGFKSIKSIVKIRLTEFQPPAPWNQMSPGDYGFLANVNPEVSHPRWCQKRERRIGELSRRETLPFNGYAVEVASLYSGADLQTQY